MKKAIICLIAASLLLSLAACAAVNSAPGDTSAVLPEPDPMPEVAPLDPGTASLPELMERILTDVPDLPGVGEITLDETNFEFYAFAAPVEGAEGLVSEALVNATPHSVVLVRLPEGEDAQAFAREMEKNADPRKWICAEAETTSVVQEGNLILLCMSFRDTSEAIVNNFVALFRA